MTLLLSLDLATRTGWALGDPSGKPTVSAWKLKGEDHYDVAGALAERLRDVFMLGGISLVAVEAPLRPEAFKDAEAEIRAIAMQGAVNAVARCYGVPVRRTAVGTIRKHFCGQATALPAKARGTGPRTAKEREAARRAVKEMVWKRAVALGYFERGDTPDYDMSDAVAVFDHAAATFCRISRPLVMFSESAQ